MNAGVMNHGYEIITVEVPTTEHLRRREPSPLKSPPVGVLLRRAFKLWWYLTSLCLRLLFRTPRGEPAAIGTWRAQQVKQFLEGMQGLYIKIGQFLSVRTDIFSLEFCHALSALFDRVSPFPSETSVAIIERELCAPLDKIFSEFQREPIAAASLGQVHVGRLRGSGRKVAVKVRRPGIEDVISADLKLLGNLAAAIDFLITSRHLRVTPMIDEIRVIIDEELSYLAEARGGADFRKSLKGRKHVYAPRMYFEYTTDRVLVMEFIEGTPMTAIVRAVESRDTLKLSELHAQGIRPKKLATRLHREVLQQLMEHHVMHSDPHPGNIIVMEDNVLGFIDFGAVGYFSAGFRARYDKLMRAYAHNDIDGLVQAHLELGEPLPPGNIDEYVRQLKQIYARQAAEAQSEFTHPRDRLGERYQAEISRLGGIYGMPISWELLRVGRATTMANVVVLALHPEFDFLKASRRYYLQRVERMSKATSSPERFKSTLRSYGELIHQIPQDYVELRDRVLKILKRDQLWISRHLSAAKAGVLALLKRLAFFSKVGVAALVVLRLVKGADWLNAALHSNLDVPVAWWVVALGLLYIARFSRELMARTQVYQPE
nr:hypothetical protein [Cystobacter sp.]